MFLGKPFNMRTIRSFGKINARRKPIGLLSTEMDKKIANFHYKTRLKLIKSNI